MKEFSVEQKLELAEFLKREQEINRMQMQKRETILYGKKYAPIVASDDGTITEQENAAWDKEFRKRRNSFFLRLLVAFSLFCIVLLMKANGLVLADIGYDTVIKSLQNQDFTNGIDFDKFISYTVETGNSGGNK